MRNLTLTKYIRSKDALEYSFLKHAKPSENYGKHKSDIKNMTYEEVKGVIKTISNMKTWDDLCDVFETVFKITKEQFYKGLITDFFAARNFIVKEFKNIIETEHKLLSSISKDYGKWIAAGGERLNRFGDVLPLNQLGKIYNIYPFKLKDKKYQEILLLLTIEKEQQEIERKMNE